LVKEKQMELKERLDKKIEAIKELQTKAEGIDAQKKKLDDDRSIIIQELLRVDGECRLLDQMIKEAEPKKE
jgi:CII-binding regulator of phage lambda lysogenization HflD